LKRIEIESTTTNELLEDLLNKIEKLRKLAIICKVPRKERPDCSDIESGVKELLLNEKGPDIKKLNPPEHLICQLKGDFMDDPVTI